MSYLGRWVTLVSLVVTLVTLVTMVTICHDFCHDGHAGHDGHDGHDSHTGHDGHDGPLIILQFYGSTWFTVRWFAGTRWFTSSLVRRLPNNLMVKINNIGLVWFGGSLVRWVYWSAGSYFSVTNRWYILRKKWLVGPMDTRAFMHDLQKISILINCVTYFLFRLFYWDKLVYNYVDRRLTSS